MTHIGLMSMVFFLDKTDQSLVDFHHKQRALSLCKLAGSTHGMTIFGKHTSSSIFINDPFIQATCNPTMEKMVV